MPSFGTAIEYRPFVGRRPLGRVGDHHGHTDERVALFVRNRTSDGGLGESLPGSRQQQEQRP